MSEELLQHLPVLGYGEKGMTRSEVAEGAGIEYKKAKRNLDELYRVRLYNIVTGGLNRL